MFRARQIALARAVYSPRLDNIGHRTTRAAGITFLGVAGRVLITIASTAVLARLLRPADFGHLAMATTVTELAALFSNFGISSILIQRRHLHRIHLDTAFWASGGLGVILMVVVFAGSYAVERFFGDPAVGLILRALSVMFLLEEISVVQVAVITRLMRFKQDVIIQNGMLIVRGAVAIGLAAAGFGVWSLVAGTLVGRIATLIVGWYFVPFVPRLRISRRFIRENWRVGTSYFGGGMLFYLQNNLDLILIGRRLGPTPLGYYQAARSLGDEMRNRIIAPLGRVLFPAYSLLQADPPRFRRGILRSTRLLAGVLVPLGVGLSATAPDVVRLLYGEKWLPMIPVLEVLAIAAAMRASFSNTGAIFTSLNRVSMALNISLLQSFVLFACIAGGGFFGLIGVAYGILLSTVAGPVGTWFACKLTDMPLRTMAGAMVPPWIAAGVMFVTLRLARPLLANLGWSTATALFTEVVLGMLVYTAAMALVSRETLRDGLGALHAFLPQRTRKA